MAIIPNATLTESLFALWSKLKVLRDHGLIYSHYHTKKLVALRNKKSVVFLTFNISFTFIIDAKVPFAMSLL